MSRATGDQDRGRGRPGTGGSGRARVSASAAARTLRSGASRWLGSSATPHDAPPAPAPRPAALITRTAAIAGVYAAVTLVLQPISFGPLQMRVAEALNVLPYVAAPAVPGLFLGCVLANLLGGFGWHDVVFGSLATLLAALLTRWFGRMRLAPALAPLPAVLLNALIVPAYLHALLGLPYWLTAAQILLGQTLACYGLGYPLLGLLLRRQDLADRLR